MSTKYICFLFVIFSTTSCRKSNSELVIDSKEYLKNEGHIFINNHNYRNQEWTLTYNKTKDKSDTVQIDKKIVSGWIRSGLVNDLKYDIVDRVSYFTLDLENKNGFNVVLVHQAGEKYNCMKVITDTSKFNKLGAFKYQIDEHWLLFSAKDFKPPSNVIFH
jgi:hypothetical protein